jgi:hypothetical protein
MVFIVLLRPMIVSLVAAIGTFSASGLAAAKSPKNTKAPKGPTAKQIHAAVANAERSPDLWATVNVCTSAPAPTGDVVGIRGQMPSLGFPAMLLMDMSVQYWNYPDSKFEPVSDASSMIPLGKGTHGIHQGGVSFPFAPPSPGLQFLVRGTVSFEWKIGAKVVGTVSRVTGHGYPNVAFSDPAGFSAGTCTLT